MQWCHLRKFIVISFIAYCNAVLFIISQVKSKDPKNITAFDARGPGNTGIIVECFSPNPNHTKGIIQGMIKKHG